MESCAVCQMAARCLLIVAFFSPVTAANAAGEESAAEQGPSDRDRRRDRELAGLTKMFRQELANAILEVDIARDGVVRELSADDRSQILERIFDEALFGRAGRDPISELRHRFDVALDQKLITIKWVCGLSEAQQRQLELAGRGDIKRYFDRADEQRRQLSTCEARDGPTLQKISREMAELREQMTSGVHEEDSLFARMLAKALSPEQAGRIPVIRDVERAGGKIQSQFDGNTTINEIRLSARTFTDAELAHLNGVSDLHRLALDGTQITDRGLASLRKMEHLKYLDLARTKSGDDGLVNLRGLAELQDLDLTGTGVTDAGLEYLRDLVNLRRLYLYGTKISDAGLANLKSLTRLQLLHLGQTRITDAGLAGLNLKAMESLEDLHLEGTTIGDASLTQFDGLKNLQTLDLRMTRVSDAGIARLSGMSQLKFLYLYHTHVTDAGIASLKASLPALKVVP
jgi:hypothetical protein